MDGVINVYKEKGYTSFHVVAVIRAMTGEKKTGHTGTLDPDATGVLPICIGKATKLVSRLTDTDKKYHAVMIFGKRTDTQDVSGKVLEEMHPEDVASKLNEELIKKAFDKLTGEIEQIPPMYSAVKVDGVKLVDAARKGREIERESRRVTVYGYENICFDSEKQEASFDVSCSKGTYVRTICETIGKLLGVPACLKELERTRAAGLEIKDTYTLSQLDELKKDERLEECIIPTDSFLMEYPSITVKDETIKRLIFGNWLTDEDFQNPSPEENLYRVYDREGGFYALYRYDANDRFYKCEKMFR